MNVYEMCLAEEGQVKMILDNSKNLIKAYIKPQGKLAKLFHTGQTFRSENTVGLS